MSKLIHLVIFLARKILPRRIRHYINIHLDPPIIAHRAKAYYYFFVDYIILHSIKFKLQIATPRRKLIAINLIEHFGDIVACEPVARYVRNKYKDDYIIWTIRRPYIELVENHPDINKPFPIYCLTEWMLLSETGLFDEIIDLHFQLRECPYCNKSLLKKAGNTSITIHNYYNHGNLLSACCQSAGLPPLDAPPQLYLTDKNKSRVDAIDMPEEYIVVHCMSNETVRDWLKEKWMDLGDRILLDTRYSVVEIGTEPCLDTLAPLRYVNLCGKLSLLETAEVIRRAKLFIGVDSGPAHLANAVGTYGIILIGHYRAFCNYMPYSGWYKSGENAHIIYTNGHVSGIDVNDVYTSIVDYLILQDNPKRP